MAFQLKVNGQAHAVDAADDTPLLWVLRENLGLTGTKFGCGIAQCGACTVFLDGKPLRSCSLPVAAVGGAEITTIEGLSGRESEAVQRARRRSSARWCGPGPPPAATARRRETALEKSWGDFDDCILAAF